MAVVLMSRAELSRVDTLARVDRGAVPVAEAASLLGLSGRQVFRLLARFRSEGAAGLASRRRGRPSNRRLPGAVREAVLAILREHYPDFGPTLAAEKLAERHDLRLSRETLRHWMADAGLWVPRKARRGRVHQPRHRRDCSGELVQIDGCDHAWFEDRGPPCTLLVFIDDATGRLMQLRFVPAESAFSYFEALQGYLEAHGRPVAFYSDKHAVFRVAKTEAKGGQGMTQFGRGSCPLGWCRSTGPRQGPRFAQAATADSLSTGSSLKWASDSRLMHRRETAHSSFCSSISAPTSRTTARSFGKMPITSALRLISPFRRSNGFVEAICGQCSRGKVM